MGKRVRKRGLPKALEAEADTEAEVETRQTPEEFVEEFFGSTSSEQEGLPSLDWLKENYKTKSAAIRYLIQQGHNVKTISKHLGLRYQHVRNVATQTLKRGPNEDWRPKAERSPQPLLPPPPVRKDDA